LKHAEEVVEPAFKKYKSLLQEVSEPHQKLDLMRAKRPFSACKLFDPFFLASDTSIDALNLWLTNSFISDIPNSTRILSRN
jgi:hypothetical protein